MGIRRFLWALPRSLSDGNRTSSTESILRAKKHPQIGLMTVPVAIDLNPGRFGYFVIF